MGGSNSVLSTIGHVLSGATQLYSGGIVNPDKGRINVPFTSAQVREIPKGYLGMVSGGKLNKSAGSIFDSNTAKTLGQIGAAIEGIIVGAGAGSALSTPASVAGSTASAAGGASTAVVPVGVAGTTPVLGVAGATGGAAAGGASTAAVGSGIAGTAPVGFGAAPAAAPAIGSGFSTTGAAVGAATVGTAGSVLASGKTPPLPGAPTPQSLDTAVQDAANAVQTADAEARRQRARKRQSSVLGGYQGSTQVGLSPATLQPAPARKSVLG